MKNSRILFLTLFFFIFASLPGYSQNPLPSPVVTDPSTGAGSTFSVDELKKLGVSESQIRQAMEMKLKREATTNQVPVTVETSPFLTNIDTAQPTIDTAITYPKSTIYGQDFFRKTPVKIFERSSDARAPENYVLGTGDEISISIWGFADFNQVFKIDGNGSISHSSIGRVYLKGTTLENARALLKTKFSKVYDLNNSQFDMNVVFSRIITVNIVGEVFNPGSFSIPAINTAFNALISSGGPTEMGSLRNITVKRNGKVIRVLDVYAFLQNPGVESDFFLEDNDYLLVPSISNVIEITGAVRRPFKYEVLEKESILSAINFAGGFTSNAHTGRVQVERYNRSSEKVVIDVNIDSLIINKKDFILTDGDKIFVKNLSEGVRNFVTIEGAVLLPGRYELAKNEKIADLLKMSGGVLFETYLERGYVLRLNEDLTKNQIPFSIKNILNQPSSAENFELQKQDYIRIFSNEEFKDDYTVDVFGAVRTPKSFKYYEGMTLTDALFLVGGFKKEADNLKIEISRISNFEEAYQSGQPTRTIIQSVEVAKDLSAGGKASGFKLQPFDQIFVRTSPDFELQQNIEIFGEVQYPGKYSLISKNEKISDMIKRAGGTTEWAFPEGASLFRSSETTRGFIVMNLRKVLKNERSIYNYELKDGDKILIPQTIDFVSIKGEIQYPTIDSIRIINSPYIKGKRARYYINNFGNGFDKEASRKNTYVIEPNGLVHKTNNFLLFNVFPKVGKGSTINVVKKHEKIKDEKEKIPVDWNRVIENTTVKITGLVTLLILLTRVIPSK